MLADDDGDLLFDDVELARWVRHRRQELRSNVQRASYLTQSLLVSAHATPARLLILSAREILDPDQRSGFLRPVTIVIRASDHGRGRFGAWEEQGSLCIETELSPCTTLIVEGTWAHLETDRVFPESVLAALLGRPVGELISHPLLACLDAPIISAALQPATGRSLLSFRVHDQSWSFKAFVPHGLHAFTSDAHDVAWPD